MLSVLAFTATPLNGYQALVVSLFVAAGTFLLQLVLRLWHPPDIRTPAGALGSQALEMAGTTAEYCVFAEKVKDPCSADCRERGLASRAHNNTTATFSESHLDQRCIQPPLVDWCSTSSCQAPARSSPPRVTRARNPTAGLQNPDTATAADAATVSLSPTASPPPSTRAKPPVDSIQSLAAASSSSSCTIIPAAALQGAFPSSKHAATAGGGAGGMAHLATGSSDRGAAAVIAPDTACRPDNTSSAYDFARALVRHAWAQPYTPVFTLGRVALKIPDRHPSDLPPLEVWTRPYCEALEGEGIALVGAYVRQGCIHIVLDFLDLALGRIGGFGGGGGGGSSSSNSSGGRASSSSLSTNGGLHSNSNSYSPRQVRHQSVTAERSERLCSSSGPSRSNSRRRFGRAVASKAAAGEAEGGGAAAAAAAITSLTDPWFGRPSDPGDLLRRQLTGRRNAPARVMSADASAVAAGGAASIVVALMRGAAAAGRDVAGGAQRGRGDGDDGSSQCENDGGNGDDDDDGDGSGAGSGTPRSRRRLVSTRRLRQLRHASASSLLLSGGAAAAVAAAAAAPSQPPPQPSASRDGAAGAAAPPPPSGAAVASRLQETLTPQLLVQLLGPDIGGGGQTVTVQLPLGGGAWGVQMVQMGAVASAAAAAPAPRGPPDLSCISPPCVLAGAQGPVMLYAAGTDMHGMAASPSESAAAAGSEGSATVHVRFRGAYLPCRASLLGDQMRAEVLSRALPSDAHHRAEVLRLQLPSPPSHSGLMFVECQRGGLLGPALPVLVAPNAGVWQEVVALQDAAIQGGDTAMTTVQHLVLDLGLWLDYITNAPPLSSSPPQLPPQQQQRVGPPPQAPPQLVWQSPPQPQPRPQPQPTPSLDVGGGTTQVDPPSQLQQPAPDELSIYAVDTFPAAATTAATAAASTASATAAARQREQSRTLTAEADGDGLGRLVDKSLLQLLISSEPPPAPPPRQEGLLLLEEVLSLAERLQQQQHEPRRRAAGGGSIAIATVRPSIASTADAVATVATDATAAASAATAAVAAPAVAMAMAVACVEKGAAEAKQMAVAGSQLLAPNMSMAYGSSPGSRTDADGSSGGVPATAGAEAIQYIRTISDPQTRRMLVAAVAGGRGDTADGAFAVKAGDALLVSEAVAAVPVRGGGGDGGGSTERTEATASGGAAAAVAAAGGGGRTTACSPSVVAGVLPRPPHAQSMYNGRWQLPSLPLSMTPSNVEKVPSGPPHLERSGDTAIVCRVHQTQTQTHLGSPSAHATDSGAPSEAKEAADAEAAADAGGSSPAISADLMALGPAEAATLSQALYSGSTFMRAGAGANGSSNLPPLVRTESSGTELHSWDSLTEVAMAVSASLPPSSSALAEAPRAGSTAAVSLASPSTQPSTHLSAASPQLRASGTSVAAAATAAIRSRLSEDRESSSRPAILRRTLRHVSAVVATESMEAGRPTPTRRCHSGKELEPESAEGTPLASPGGTIPAAAAVTAAPAALRRRRQRPAAGARERASSLLEPDDEPEAAPPPTANIGAPAAPPGSAASVAAEAAVVAAEAEATGAVSAAAAAVTTVSGCLPPATVLARLSTFEPSNATPPPPPPPQGTWPAFTAAAVAAAPRPAAAARALHARMRLLGIGLLAFSVRRGWVHTTEELLAGLARVGVDLAAANAGVAAREGGMGLLHLAVIARRPAMLRALLAASAAPAAGSNDGAGAGGEAVRIGELFVWDVAARGPMGLTPLHLATVVDDGGEMAALLLGAFPDAPTLWFDATDDGGCTPAEMAAQARMEGLSQWARMRLAANDTAGRQRQLQQLHQQLPQHQQAALILAGSMPQELPPQQRLQILPWNGGGGAATAAVWSSSGGGDVVAAATVAAFTGAVGKGNAATENGLEPAGVMAVAGSVATTIRAAGADAATAAAVKRGNTGKDSSQSAVARRLTHRGPRVGGPLCPQQQQIGVQGRRAAWLRNSLIGFGDQTLEGHYRMYRATSLAILDTTCGIVFSCLFLLPALELIWQRDGAELVSHCVFNAGLLGPYVLHATAPRLFRRHRDAALAMGDVMKALLVVLSLLGALPLPRVWANFTRCNMDVIMLVVMKPLSEQIRMQAALLQRTAAVVSDTHIYARLLYGGALLPAVMRAVLQNIAALTLLLLLDVRARLRFMAADAAGAHYKAAMVGGLDLDAPRDADAADAAIDAADSGPHDKKAN